MSYDAYLYRLRNASGKTVRAYVYIYIFIRHNMIERTEQKVQQKSTHKKEKKTTIEQVTQIYI